MFLWWFMGIQIKQIFLNILRTNHTNGTSHLFFPLLVLGCHTFHEFTLFDKMLDKRYLTTKLFVM